MDQRSLEKKCKFNKRVILFTFLLTIATLIAIWISTFKYYYNEIKCNKVTMEKLPVGSFQRKYDSPSKKYTINSYICGSGGLPDWAARCEVVNNMNGEVRNIYWDYKIKLIDVKWINDNTVSINGHKINVENDVYDWRKV
ncbi:hypothetical protein BUL45_16020 [Clostridium perfringens]|nr:hypothetical protein [Clostridium perfringens]